MWSRKINQSLWGDDLSHAAFAGFVEMSIAGPHDRTGAVTGKLQKLGRNLAIDTGSLIHDDELTLAELPGLSGLPYFMQVQSVPFGKMGVEHGLVGAQFSTARAAKEKFAGMARQIIGANEKAAEPDF